MKKFLDEFKEFIQQGNVMDMAVGVIIGAAFKAIVDSLVADIISPILGIFLNNNFGALSVNIAGATLKYGSFIMAIINFLIMAFILFSIIKTINRFKKKEPEAAPTTKECPHCKSIIPLAATKCPHCTADL